MRLICSFVFFITACPVGGQIRVGCGSACNMTCANMNMGIACPDVCIINGCQCPDGTVIDEQSNTCVVPSDCPPAGSYVTMVTNVW